jgi:hypothetical protein
MEDESLVPAVPSMDELNCNGKYFEVSLGEVPGVGDDDPVPVGPIEEVSFFRGYGVDVPDDDDRISADAVPREIGYVWWIVMGTVFMTWTVVVVVNSRELLLLLIEGVTLGELVGSWVPRDEIAVRERNVEDVEVMRQEQADDMRDGIPEQWETNGGRPVVAAFSAVVYVAQKAVAAEDLNNWRKQLSWLHTRGLWTTEVALLGKGDFDGVGSIEVVGDFAFVLLENEELLLPRIGSIDAVAGLSNSTEIFMVMVKLTRYLTAAQGGAGGSGGGWLRASSTIRIAFIAISRAIYWIIRSWCIDWITSQAVQPLR